MTMRSFQPQARRNTNLYYVLFAVRPVERYDGSMGLTNINEERWSPSPEQYMFTTNGNEILLHLTLQNRAI